MSINCSNSPSWCLPLLVLFYKLSKTQRYSIYNNIKDRRSAHLRVSVCQRTWGGKANHISLSTKTTTLLVIEYYLMVEKIIHWHEDIGSDKQNSPLCFLLNLYWCCHDDACITFILTLKQTVHSRCFIFGVYCPFNQRIHVSRNAAPLQSVKLRNMFFLVNWYTYKNVELSKCYSYLTVLLDIMQKYIKQL